MSMARYSGSPWVARIATGLGVLLFLGGVALAMRLVVRLVPWEPNYTIDFDYYILAGASLWRGENPYTAAIQLHAEHIAGGYVYPPLLAWLMVPLGAILPARLPYLVWVLAEIVGFAASLALTLRTGVRPVHWHWVILAVGAAFVPYVTWFDLYHGQVDFTLLVCIVAGLYLVAKDRPVAGGFVLALAPSIKPFLAVLILYLAWRCRWRAMFSMGIAGLGLLVLSFLPTLSQGTAVVEGWMEASRTASIPPLSGHAFNLSIYGTLTRLFTPTPYAVPWVESRPLFLSLTFLFGLVAPVVWLLAVPPGPLRRRADLPISLVETGLLLTLLFAYGPIAEANHLLVLCPVIFVTIRLALNSHDAGQRRRWRPAALAWGLFVLCTAGPLVQTTWTAPLPGVPEGLTVLLTGRVGALLLLAGLATAWSLAQEHQASNRHLSLRSALASLRSGRAWPRPGALAGGAGRPARAVSGGRRPAVERGSG